MRSIFQYAESVAPSAKPVLITGETGVGKELMAQALHHLSERKGPLVTVNAAGLDDNVFSDTLFGHTKGAFTGADRTRPGLIAQAARGTLFLDEIGALSAASQVKLLRLLQDREYFPLGADLPKRADARIIVATNQELRVMQETGAFRKDLYFRLRTHHVHLPPLRERLDDLPALLSHFLEQAAKALGKKKPTWPPQLASLLATYPFPGNIRELESIVFDAISVHQAKVLSMAHFKSYIDAHQAQSAATPFQPVVSERGAIFALFDDLPTLKECQQLAIDEALRRSKGNQSLAARPAGHDAFRSKQGPPAQLTRPNRPKGV